MSAPDYSIDCPRTGLPHSQQVHRCDHCNAINPVKPYGSTSIGNRTYRASSLDPIVISDDEENSTLKSMYGAQRVENNRQQGRQSGGRFVDSYTKRSPSLPLRQIKNEAEENRQKAIMKNKQKALNSAGDSVNESMHVGAALAAANALELRIEVTLYAITFHQDTKTFETKEVSKELIGVYTAVIPPLRRAETNTGPKEFRERIYQELYAQFDESFEFRGMPLHYTFFDGYKDLRMTTKLGPSSKETAWITNKTFERHVTDVSKFRELLTSKSAPKNAEIKLTLALSHTVYKSEDETDPEDKGSKKKPKAEKEHKRNLSETNSKLRNKKKIKQEPKNEIEVKETLGAEQSATLIKEEPRQATPAEVAPETTDDESLEDDLQDVRPIRQLRKKPATNWKDLHNGKV